MQLMNDYTCFYETFLSSFPLSSMKHIGEWKRISQSFTLTLCCQGSYDFIDIDMTQLNNLISLVFHQRL